MCVLHEGSVCACASFQIQVVRTWEGRVFFRDPCNESLVFGVYSRCCRFLEAIIQVQIVALLLKGSKGTHKKERLLIETATSSPPSEPNMA